MNSYLYCQITRKDAGIYELVLKDDRGKDKSVLKLIDSGKTCWTRF